MASENSSDECRERHPDDQIRETVDRLSKIKMNLDAKRIKVIALDAEEDNKILRKQHKEIVHDTTIEIRLLLDILHDTTELPITHNSKGIYQNTFMIGECVCEIVCKLCTQRGRSSSSGKLDDVEGLVKIINLFNHAMEYLIKETTPGRAHIADIKTMSKEWRRSIHTLCTGFCRHVCTEMKSSLNALKLSTLRSQAGFKTLLVCVVKQFLYIQQTSTLAKDLLECTNEDEQHNTVQEYKMMFTHIWSFLNHGLFMLRTVRFEEFSEADVDVAYNRIKTCRSTLFKYFTSRFGRNEFLIIPLREIKRVSFEICESIVCCLPPGQVHIADDVTAPYPCEEENSSDFEDFFDKNGSDFIGSLTRCSMENNEEQLKASDIEKTELIQSYKMEGFKSPIKVCVDNQRPFICPSVGGKVLQNGEWVSANVIKIEENKVEMEIVPGELFVVHYKFPSGQQKFEGEDLRNGITMPIPNTTANLNLGKSEGDDVTVEYKVHLPDKYRLQGYQDENPEKFGSIDILPGIQTSVSKSIKNGTMELPVEKPNKGTVYIVLTMDPNNQHVDRKEIQPKPQDRKISFDMSLNTNSMAFIVKDASENSKKVDTESALSILGFKSICQLLTLYRVPSNVEDHIVELRVYCIESKRNDLKRTVESALKNKWMQIEGETPSPDFIISSEENITLEFKGDVEQTDGLPEPTMTFIRNGTCFVQSQLQFLNANEMRGRLLMHHGNVVRDWKPLQWESMRANYKVMLESETSRSRSCTLL